MAFKEVKDELPEIWNPEKEGDQIQGVLTQKKQNIGKNKSMFYVLEVSEGVRKGVWGSTVLDNKMALVKEGSLLRITYQGVDKEKSYHKFLLEQDE